jgi:AcrR family transcriptional regulator
MRQAEGSRPYHSPRREAQARATRLDVLTAARRLFVELGYVATTVVDVAAAAGVAKKTVTTAFATKHELLMGVWELALDGGRAGWYGEALTEPDPYRLLERVAHATRLLHDRAGDVMATVAAAAGVDPAIREHQRKVEAEVRADHGRIVARLAANGALRPELSTADATDLLAALNGGALYQSLVVARGWDATRFEAWHAAALQHHLLVPR